MPFTTEQEVRLRCQLTDVQLAPAALVEACINCAHDEVIRRLDPLFDVDPPEHALVAGETLLAGAHLFRAIAGKQAVDQRQLTIGGQRIEAGTQFEHLMQAAADNEENAWCMLAPYLRALPAIAPGVGTDTVPVLGET